MSDNKIYDFKILSKTDSIKCLVLLNKNHPIYLGHFPNQPIAPGAIMLQILKELAEELLQVDLLMQEALNVKFLTMVNPHINSELIFDFKVEEVENIFKIKNVTTFPDNTIVLKCSAVFNRLPKNHLNIHT